VLTDRIELSVAGFGVNDALVPPGNPVALSVTEPVKAPAGVITIV
jgi:hypothetical protein